MLEQFRESQPQFVSHLEEVMTDTKKISHAYLIETNSFQESEELVFAFAKILLCPNALFHKTSDECSICHLIDQRKYSDLQIIEPSGAWIKKEQLLDLQANFKTKSIVGGRRVYIIFQAEKLNISSANTLLKFLEEPEDNIVAILVTTNRYQVIETILSRCQVISLYHNEKIVGNEELDEILFQFLAKLYKYNTDIISYMNSLWHDYFKNKEDYLSAIKELEKIYIDLLEHQDDVLFLIKKYGQAVEKIISNLSICDIIRKLKVIDTFKRKLQYNVNMKLWLDDFIISLCKEGDFDV